MAPTRKSKSVNKRYSDYVEGSPSKTGGNKSKRQKRKLSDMLGSQWTDEEVERFYNSYRKYGKDWKKVAAMVRTRNSEMVEALYTMNRAYLSLPEGTASVVGFIAMVSDHYNALEGSDNDQEINDFPKSVHKPKKRSHGLLQKNPREENQLHSRVVPSTGRCLPQLKRRESDGCTVRKRTPRFPINHSSRRENNEIHISPYKRNQKREVDDVAHGAALALTEALQRGGSPQVSQSPYRTKTTPLKGRQKNLDMVRTKPHGNLIDEDCFEGSSGSGGAENKAFEELLYNKVRKDYGVKGENEFDDSGDVNTFEEFYSKVRKDYGKTGEYKFDDSRDINTDYEEIFKNLAAEATYGQTDKYRFDDSGDVETDFGKIFENLAAEAMHEKKDENEFDDGGEACSGTGEGLAVGGAGSKFDIEVADENIERLTTQGKKKRNKKLFFRDETSGLDALQTLADLSLMIQSSKEDSDLPVLKEDKPPTGYRRNRMKASAEKERVSNDASKSGKLKPGRESKVDYKALSEGKLQDQSNKSLKRKNKLSSTEAGLTEEEKCGNKVICTNEDNPPFKNRLVEYSSSNSNTSRTGADSAISTALIRTSDGVDLPSKRRNKRKANPNRIENHGEIKLTKVNSKDQPNEKTEPEDRHHYLKDKASCYLSSAVVRKWSTYEWFYSAIDYPWFAKREFVEYLNHVGLGHIPRLTKVEWGVIRSSLGKPRRFSPNFLCEEREKLWQYRESVRKHYTELRSGVREGLPTDLARPLAVGQRVVAIHPESREVHDGCVLTVDHDKCRIQFDRPELGVAFVKDIDCMPLNLLDNMPEALRRESSALYRFSMNPVEPRLPQSVTGSLTLHPSSEQNPTITLMNKQLGHNGSGAPTKAADNIVSQHATYAPQPQVSQFQARETDIHALSELTRALDKKEAILTELKLVNDGLMSHKIETGLELKVSESFRKEYATVLLQLKEASDQVTHALLNLRQRNTYPGNTMPSWQKPPPSTRGTVGPLSTVDNFQSNNQLPSSVVEIVNNSRLEAHKLVHTAMQAMSKIKVDQNVHSSVVAVLDSLGVKKNHTEYGSSTISHSEQLNAVGAYNKNHKLNYQPDPLLDNNNAIDSKSQLYSDETDATIPFDLIVSCVATYHMIQMCTERQYPPADVVQMLDSAFTNLHPQCAQNLPIFREIQMCMGRVKTQILALVPS